jgi:hypothetical protein
MVGFGPTSPQIGACAHRFELATQRYQEMRTLIELELNPLFQSNPLHISFPGEPTNSFEGAHLILPPGFEELLSRPLDRANALASEVLHYTRSSLDHLVNYLAWLDSGQPQRHVQLFLTPKQDVWIRRRRVLKGLSEEHRRVFDDIQPFNGVEWTENLSKLSNHDKHTDDVRISAMLTMSYDPAAADPMPSPVAGHQSVVMGSRPELELRVMADSDLAARRDSLPLAAFDRILDGASSLIMTFIRESDVGR